MRSHGRGVGGGCSYEFSSFLVGTKRFMVDRKREMNILDKMDAEGISCRRVELETKG